MSQESTPKKPDATEDKDSTVATGCCPVSTVASTNDLANEPWNEPYVVRAPNTTKICPCCDNTYLVNIRSQRMKLCGDCGVRIEWPLDKGQKPLT